MNDKYLNEFPILGQKIFLDHASMSPLPKRSVAAGCALLGSLSTDGHSYFTEWMETRSQVKSMLASLLNCDPAEVALTKNTSEGILIVANGLEWEKGDNVILFANEFPANIYPWINLQSKGVEIRIVPETDGQFLIEDIEEKIDDKTRVLSLSFVEFSTGFKHDLKRIGEICKKNNIIFVVDAIQGLGAVPIDVKECHIDFLSAAGHKWLLATTGIGCFYANLTSIDKLTEHNFGYGSVENPFDFFDINQSPKPNAGRFEEGMFNIIGIYIFEASLKIITEVGVDQIYSQLIDLTDYLIKNIKDKGYQLLTPTDKSVRSGIVSFYSNNHATKTLYDNLIDNNIVVSDRRDCIRVSPHFYNTTTHLDKLLNLLPEG